MKRASAFQFQERAGTLIQESATQVNLAGGALAPNVFWQVADAVTIRTKAHLEGIILGKTSITLENGASITGRALAQTEVTLDGNTITAPYNMKQCEEKKELLGQLLILVPKFRCEYSELRISSSYN